MDGAGGVNLRTPNDATDDTNTLVRVNRILATVFNVNKKGTAYVYEADLLAADASADIAVLHINKSKTWNIGLPKLKKKCHPYLCWGSSRRTCKASTVHSIGGNANNDYQSFNTGVVRDNRYYDQTGQLAPELLNTSLEMSDDQVGSPFLDKNGLIIGMFTRNLGDQFAAGPAEFFLKRIIKVLIRGPANSKTGKFLTLVTDSLGNWYRYTKGYLGITAHVVKALDFDTTRNAVSCVLANDYDAAGPKWKKIEGVYVDAVDGDVTANCFLYSSGTDSPLLGTVLQDDIITKINGCELGSLCRQVPMADILWTRVVGEEIDVTYRKVSEDYLTSYVFRAALVAYPDDITTGTYDWAGTEANISGAAVGFSAGSSRAIASKPGKVTFKDASGKITIPLEETATPTPAPKSEERVDVLGKIVAKPPPATEASEVAAH